MLRASCRGEIISLPGASIIMSCALIPAPRTCDPDATTAAVETRLGQARNRAPGRQPLGPP